MALLKKLMLVLAILTVSHQVHAASSLNTTDDEAPSRWSVDGIVQAHSIAGPSSPLFGFGGSYNILQSWSLGLRGLVPLSHTTDNATYSLQVVSRVRVYNLSNSEFFIEPDYAYNFYNFVPFKSYGLAFGVLNRVAKSLAIGIEAGVEIANDVIDSKGIETSSGEIVYPKVSLIARFNF